MEVGSFKMRLMVNGGGRRKKVYRKYAVRCGYNRMENGSFKKLFEYRMGSARKLERI